MLNFFMAGPDLVSWDLTALGPQGDGPVPAGRPPRGRQHHRTFRHGDRCAHPAGSARIAAGRGARRRTPFDVKPLPVQKSNAAISVEEDPHDSGDRRRPDRDRDVCHGASPRRVQRENRDERGERSSGSQLVPRRRDHPRPAHAAHQRPGVPLPPSQRRTSTATRRSPS